MINYCSFWVKGILFAKFLRLYTSLHDNRGYILRATSKSNNVFQAVEGSYHFWRESNELMVQKFKYSCTSIFAFSFGLFRNTNKNF